MFTISTKIQYGLLALIALAQEEGGRPVPLSFIAKKLNLSFKYLENIFKLLSRGRIVAGTRGPEGGYVLEKNPKELFLYDIFHALDGPLFTVECLDEEAVCTHFTLCPVRDLWKGLRLTMSGFLKKRTLADILSKDRRSPLSAHIRTHGRQKDVLLKRRNDEQKISLS